MQERFRLISNRKRIPSDIAAAGIPSRIDILDALGTSLTRTGWQEVLCALPGNAELRLLLLDPEGSAVTQGATCSRYWWDDAEKARRDIQATVATVADVARDRRVGLHVRYYDRPPVSRYVCTDQQIYQSGYPEPDATEPLPVAVLSRDSVLGQRAEREFAVLWSTRSRTAVETARRHGATAGRRLAPASDAGESAELVTDRKALPAHALARLDSLRHIDVIDVAGAAQVGEPWQHMLRDLGAESVHMRVLLLDPDGDAAHLRAAESTRWQGDDAGLRAKIRRNVSRLHVLPDYLNVDVAVRVYDDLPVSRYVRLDHLVYQSVYPSNESAKGKPLAVVTAESVLGQRALREFEVMWTALSRDVAGGHR
jgi:hypothetical protein